ncbi:MAG: hypothetical protein JSW00_10940 [Thermoplasmata archaeon]|nr:MAG: hypothetical protein JSW00_10940 [Thermoplasmata archaeon]
MNSIKINYGIEKNTVTKLKSYTIDNFRSKDLHLWIGVEAIQGDLVIELNDKYIFEIPKNALEELEKDNLIINSISDPYNRLGLNGVCLLDWYSNLVKLTIELIRGKKEVAIEIIEHSIDITINKDEKYLYLSFDKFRNGKSLHWISPYIIHDIKDEPISHNIFINEVIRSTNLFVNELLEINPGIKEEEVFNKLQINLKKLIELNQD